MDELVSIQGMDNNGRFFDNQNNLIWSPNDISALPSYMPAVPNTGIKLNQVDSSQLATRNKVGELEAEITLLKEQMMDLKDTLDKYLKYERRKLDE